MTVYILIVASKHRNIQIVMCTPKIFCRVLKKNKRDIYYTTAQKVIHTLAFELSVTVQKKKKRELKPESLYIIIPQRDSLLYEIAICYCILSLISLPNLIIHLVGWDYE